MRTREVLRDARIELAMIDEAINMATEEDDMCAVYHYEELADFWVTIIKEFEQKAFKESLEHSYELYHTILDKSGLDFIMKKFNASYTYPPKESGMSGPDAPMYKTVFTTELTIAECWEIVFEQKKNFLIDGVREVKR